MHLENLIEQLGTAARTLGGEDVEHTLERAVALAVELIEGCDGAGVCLARKGEPLQTPVSTGEFVANGDALQHELQEGPCMDAAWTHEMVISTDLAVEERWPTWGPRVVAELEVRSMMCLQLFVAEESLGVLNLYSKQHNGALTQVENRHEAQALAAHVAVALDAAQEIAQLHQAVLSRTVIGQAEGIIMERFDITAHTAFEVLKRASSYSNVKLYQVAEQIVSTRIMPTRTTPSTQAAQPSDAPVVAHPVPTPPDPLGRNTQR